MDKYYSDYDWKGITPHSPPGYEKNKHNVVFDQHSHTILSDGALTIKQNVEWHLAMGYNALAITDHNNMRHLEKLDRVRKEYVERGIIILSGIEWTTNKIHLNFLGLSNWNRKIAFKTTNDQIIDAINRAKEKGAIVVCNHIPWSLYEYNMKDHPSRETLLDWGIDFIEIVNDDSLPENVYDRESYEFCNQHKNEVGMITGTDMHAPDKLVGGGVRGWTLMNLNELTEEALIEELRKKHTEIIYSKTPYLDPGIHQNEIQRNR